jgi:hypothetical protein
VNAVDYLLNAGIAKGRAFKALRDGRITGALKQGMRWLASPASLDAWIESTSTRPSPKVETGGRLAALMNYGPR